MKRLALALLLLPALLVAQVSTKSDVVYEAPDMTAGHAIPWCVTGKIIQSDGSVWQCVDLPSLVETDPQVDTVTSGNFCKGTGTTVSCTDAIIPATSVDDALTETDNAWITGGWTFDPSDGGSPFSVFSSTAVMNLNADFLDGKHEPYFVHHVSDYTLNHTNYQNLYFRSLCVNTLGGNSVCSSPTIDFTQVEAVTSDAQWDSYSPNAGGTNGLLATWTLTNSGSLFPAVNTWSLRLTEACHTAGCGYTARAIRDVLEVSVPNSTGAATLLVDGAAVLTAEADGVVGNEVANVSGTTLTRSGTGTGGDPYLVALNLTNANTWTAAQTFAASADAEAVPAIVQNSEVPLTGETGQIATLRFNLLGSVGGVEAAHEAASIRAYKVSDWYHASDESDHDAGLKFYATNNGTETLAATLTNAGALTVPSLVTAVYYAIGHSLDVYGMTTNNTANATGNGANVRVWLQNAKTNASGAQGIMKVLGSYNQNSGTSTASNTELILDRSVTSEGTGVQRSLDCQRATVSVFSVGNGASRPTCDATTRMMLFTTAGGAGAADAVEICTKNADDNYTWKALF